MTSEPKQMDPERLSALRSDILARPHSFPRALVCELLADRDYHAQRSEHFTTVSGAMADMGRTLQRVAVAVGWPEDMPVEDPGELVESVESLASIGRRWNADSSLKQWFPFTAGRLKAVEAEVASQRERAEAAERERDELIRAAANIGVEMLDDVDDKFGPFGSAGAITRLAASLMVAAVRMHGPKVETGIACEVTVDGRILEVIAQWTDAPARSNAVAFAGSVFKAITDVAEQTGVPRGEAEQPLAWLSRAQSQLTRELARANELLAGARSECVERTKDLAAAEVHIRHLQREAVVGHFVLELEKQIRRLRRLAEERPLDFPTGNSPADVIGVVRGELAEVEAEPVGSAAAQRESADVFTAGLHLLLAQDGVLLVELEAIVTRLDQRLSAVERGATWTQAKEAARPFEPDYASPPGDTIRDLLVERCWSYADLGIALGFSAADLSRLLAGEMPLAPQIADALESALGSPAEFWLAREEQYRADLARLAVAS